MLYYNNRNLPPESIPRNLPVLPLGDEGVENGWREVRVDELVRTYYQYYRLFPKPGWAISNYRTSEGYKNNGCSHYRCPASLRAWCVVIPQLVSKWAKYWWRFVWRGQKTY